MIQFKDYADIIENYCKENDLSFEKAKKMCRSTGLSDICFQYHDPNKGASGLRDETPAPVVLIMRIQDGKPVFEQTKHTRQYL